MAISPELLDKKIKDNDKVIYLNKLNSECDELEKIVDELLERSKSFQVISKNTLHRIINKPKEISDDHFPILRNRYIAAGWKEIKYQFDKQSIEFITNLPKK
jgi:hypothetical protein